MKIRMFAVLAGLAVSACGPTGYYIANVYRADADLYVQRCPIYASKGGSSLDSQSCTYEKVQPLPPEARAALNASPASDEVVALSASRSVRR